MWNTYETAQLRQGEERSMSQIARPSGVLLSAARQPLLPGGMMNDKANNESVKNPQNKKPDLEAFLKRGLTNEDDIKYVSPGAIPDLDLYMDQITTFMADPASREEEVFQGASPSSDLRLLHEGLSLDRRYQDAPRASH